MSRKNKDKNREMNDPIVKVEDAITIDKALLIKILRDMVLGEKKRFAQILNTFNGVVSQVAHLREQVDSLQKANRSGHAALSTAIKTAGEELDEYSGRLVCAEEDLQQIFEAYNALPHWCRDNPKYARLLHYTIEDAAADAADASVIDAEEVPEEGTGSLEAKECYSCLHRLKGAQVAFTDKNYGTCTHKKSKWHKQYVSGWKYCKVWERDPTILALGSPPTSYNYNYNIDTLRRALKPTFIGIDLESGGQEEFQWVRA